MSIVLILAIVASAAVLVFVYFSAWLRGEKLQHSMDISQEQLQLVGELSDAGIWCLDAASNNMTWSAKCKVLFGVSSGERVAYERFISLLHPDDKQRTEQAIQQALKGQAYYVSEFRAVWPDKSIHWLVGKAHLVRDEQQKPLRLYGAFIDITERKKMENQLLQLTADAYRVSELQTKLAALRKETLERERQAFKELEAFSYSAAHDLRAPLMIIDGFAKTLTENYADKIDEEIKSKLRFISDGAERMRQLISDLLALSRIDRQEMKVSQISMTELARTVFEELKSAHPQRAFTFQLDSLPPARGDEGMLRQVFVNLISNAIKFTGKIDNAIISIGSKDEGKENVYYVKDNGAGFDMKQADKLFNAFQRLHSRDQFEGTGVGLSIVKRVINRHKGRIWVESKLGGGTTFYFTVQPELEEGEILAPA